MRGFTLVEILVSVTIFSTVMVMSLGALLAMSESNRKVETMKSVINTLNFALDSMSRSIRTGTDYRCGTSVGVPASCPAGNTAITFISATGPAGAGDSPYPNTEVTFCRGDATTNLCSDTGTAILRRLGSSGSFSAMTSKDVVIETLNFYVIGAEPGPGDTIQPKVTILLTGYVGVVGDQRSTFKLQTSVTQRIYDL